MKAVILAAGRSRRLFPITNRRPKCLLSVGGETLIDRLLDTLRENGIVNVVMVTGFRARLLQDYVSKQHPNTQFTFVENPNYATTLPAYGLWLVRAHLNQDILYLNSDVYCDKAILREIISHKRRSVTAIQQNEWDQEEVNIVADPSGRILRIGKHLSAEESQGEFIGVTKLGKDFNTHLLSVLEKLEQSGDRKKFAADAINLAIGQGGELYLHDVSQYKAHEIDTLEDYEIAQDLVM